MKPTLAVWMPNYNHARYIGRAIEAIARQSLRPDIFTIVDDASTDSSRTVIEQYRKKYPWITALYNTKNEGVVFLMRRGVREVDADYIFMTSADDYILPGFFETAMAAATAHPQSGIIFGQMGVEDDLGRQLYVGKASLFTDSKHIDPKEYLSRYLEQEAITNSLSAATIYNLPALRSIGDFRPELGPWCDTFAIQTLGLKYGAYHIARPVSTWVVHAGSVSQSVRMKPREMQAIISRAANIMKSPAFSEIFPKEYIRRFVWRYRITIFTQYILGLLVQMGFSDLGMNPRLRKYYYSIIHSIT